MVSSRYGGMTNLPERSPHYLQRMLSIVQGDCSSVPAMKLQRRRMGAHRCGLCKMIVVPPFLMDLVWVYTSPGL